MVSVFIESDDQTSEANKTDVFLDLNYHKKLFPDWLEKQEDFKELKEAKGNYGVNNIFAICQKGITERTEMDHAHVFDFLLNRVSYWTKTFTREMTQNIAEKLGAVAYKAGDVIYQRKNIGDIMYIVYNGEIGLYKDKTQLGRIKYNEVFGEKVIESSQKRRETAIATTDWELLTFTLKDYKNVVTNLSVQIMQENRNCLRTAPAIKDWYESKLDQACHLVEIKKIAKNNLIYDQGSKTDGIFIVKSGKLEVTSILEIDNFNQYPIAQSAWEIERITHSVKCKMGKCILIKSLCFKKILKMYPLLILTLSIAAKHY